MQTVTEETREERVEELEATSAHINEVLNIADAITERVLSSRTYQQTVNILSKINAEITRGIKMVEGAVGDLEGSEKAVVIVEYLKACRENMRQQGAIVDLMVTSARDVTLTVLSKIEPKVITKLLKKNFG